MDFTRPRFAEISSAIHQAFPFVNESEIMYSPDRLSQYFEAEGTPLAWRRIPGWASFEYGFEDISNAVFFELLFSPERPAGDEWVNIVTDECFSDRCGFRVRARDLSEFADTVYPGLLKRRMAFFQPHDLILFAEQSQLLAIMHHEGYVTQRRA